MHLTLLGGNSAGTRKCLSLYHPRHFVISANFAKPGSVLTSPDPTSVTTAGPSTVSEFQSQKPAHPPWKRLKLGPLKGWGVPHDGVVMSAAADYAQDEFRGVSGDVQVTKIRGRESQVMKNTSNVPNLHGVTNFLKIRSDEVTKVARTRNACCGSVNELAAQGITYDVEQDIGEANCYPLEGRGCHWWEWQCTDSAAIGDPASVVGLWC
ncbi:hypothetical protein K438DRAFT_1773394 [Mycena galopus ATCC 62051]|nr:hypothetical protein K438DRAFT_1773394 [Mycena galopus ATCC 62051]